MITRLARRIYRWIVLIGLLLPLLLMGPIWIYCRVTIPTLDPHTDVQSLPRLAWMALLPGLWNLLPFLLYRRLGRSHLTASQKVDIGLADPHGMGILSAGFALLGATAAIHAMLWLEIFTSTRVSPTQLSLGYMVIGFLLIGVIFVGYLVGWISTLIHIAALRLRSPRR